MFISVIIPAINEEENISQAIQSAWEAGADEVIVVDGGSTDATRQLASAENALVVESLPGRASQQNLGAAQARGDMFIFLHADSRLEANACSAIRRLSAPAWGAFRQRIRSTEAVYRLLEWGNGLRARFLAMPYGDQALYITAKHFRAAGQFPDVPFMEDYVLVRSLRSQISPTILRHITHSSPRRWQKRGVIRQTMQNWSLVLRYELGVPLETLAAQYRRHDQSTSNA